MRPSGTHSDLSPRVGSARGAAGPHTVLPPPRHVQIPWGRWMVANAPLTIELSDIELLATPRDDHEWDEGPALAR